MKQISRKPSCSEHTTGLLLSQTGTCFKHVSDILYPFYSPHPGFRLGFSAPQQCRIPTQHFSFHPGAPLCSQPSLLPAPKHPSWCDALLAGCSRGHAADVPHSPSTTADTFLLPVLAKAARRLQHHSAKPSPSAGQVCKGCSPGRTSRSVLLFCPPLPWFDMRAPQGHHKSRHFPGLPPNTR